MTNRFIEQSNRCKHNIIGNKCYLSMSKLWGVVKKVDCLETHVSFEYSSM